MCSDTLPNNLFETGKEFLFVGTVGFFFGFFFFTMPSSCSRIQVRRKVQAAASSWMSEDPIQVLTSTVRRHTLGPSSLSLMRGTAIQQ